MIDVSWGVRTDKTEEVVECSVEVVDLVSRSVRQASSNFQTPTELL